MTGLPSFSQAEQEWLHAKRAIQVTSESLLYTRLLRWRAAQFPDANSARDYFRAIFRTAGEILTR